MDSLGQFFSDKLIRRVVKALSAIHEADSPVTRQAKALLAAGELGKLSELNPAPSSFESANDFFVFTQVRDVFRKIELPNPSAKTAAEKVFLSCEAQCFESNFRLSRLSDCSFARMVIEMASRHCRRILGKVPNEIVGRHGPGAAFGVSSASCTAADKMQNPPTRTGDSDIFLPHWQQTSWGRSILDRFGTDHATEIVRGNRFTTVRKDYSKDRGICVEPSFNVFYQLGIGGVIRRRLFSVGIDLEGGQDIHRAAAQKASHFGDFATIDLSNASDTLCSELVRLILPDEWYDLLSSVRSGFTLFRGKWHRLEKFSSMGNGYTFELETLIFFCLILAVCESMHLSHEGCLVYGDDIIVPSGIANNVVSVLKFAGFTPNLKKTFLEGPFRESCGGDYFWGVDVRPHLQKRAPFTPQALIGFANGIFRSSRKLPLEHPFRKALLLCRTRIIECLPSALRNFGPDALGDILLHTDDWAKYGCLNPKWPSQVFFRVYRPATFRHVRWGHYDPSVVLTCALLRYGDGRKGITPRDAVTGYKLGWVAYS